MSRACITSGADGLRDGRLALGFGGEQVLGVGMLRMGEDFRCRSGFHDLAIGHHADPVGELAHDAQVVGDEQHGHPVLGLQLAQQFEDLRLHGDVERRRRFVGNQQFGTVGQRHGNHHPLPLTARKLVRVGGKPFPGLADADLVEQVENLVPGFIGPDLLVQVQDFRNLLLDRLQRIERGHRLLEDHGDVVAAHLPDLRFGRREQILALEQDLT
jgi:hypothetical protein